MIWRPLQMAQEMLRGVVRAGDSVIDATLGNGHDALFLAGLVGPTGHVHGFDVQAAAVDASAEKLEQSGIAESQYSLHCVSHAELGKHVAAPIAAAMFNLGYLPRADKAVITTAESTLPALAQALDLLRSGGVITVMCYPGHEGGDVEAAAVLEWAEQLPREEFRALRYGMLNAPNSPAFLVVIEKG